MAFIDEIEGINREQVAKCYQCQRCSCGCPIADEMEYTPHQIMRLILLDRRDDVLDSNTIWLCVGCETCTTRCPNDIEIASVMDACRELALRDGRKPADERIYAFYKTFLKQIQSRGRINEPMLVAMFKLASKDFFSDMGLGAKMFFKGKLKPLSPKVKDRAAIKRMFDETLHKTGTDADE